MTEFTLLEVRSHISGDGLNIWCCVSSLIIIDDFVSGEVCQCVAVAGEGVHCGEDVLEVFGVVGEEGRGTVDGVFGGIDIQNQVDAGICQELHALVVVGSVVDSVDTDGVYSQFLESGNITRTRGNIRDGVDELG